MVEEKVVESDSVFVSDVDDEDESSDVPLLENDMVGVRQ